MVPLILVALSLLAIVVEAESSPAKADDYIRVVQEDGVWWLDGAGHRFFSLGVNCVGGCYGHAEETPIDPSRKGRIVSALKGWGFNTVGSRSSPSLWDELYVADRIYTDFSEITHDVFDGSYWSGGMADRLKAEVQPFIGMKNFIGYFLDNEPEWNAERVFEFYLNLDKHRPGSQAFIPLCYPGFPSKLSFWGLSLVPLSVIRAFESGQPGRSSDPEGDYIVFHGHRPLRESLPTGRETIFGDHDRLAGRDGVDGMTYNLAMESVAPGSAGRGGPIVPSQQCAPAHRRCPKRPTTSANESSGLRHTKGQQHPQSYRAVRSNR
jgi:hypothetical protein